MEATLIDRHKGTRVVLPVLLCFVSLILFSLTVHAADDLEKEPKPHVHIIATGGTIAGTAGSAAVTVGYKAGELTVEQLIASVPELGSLARLTGEQLCNIDSKDMQEEIWLRLAKRVHEVAKRKDVDAIVITHGTDTMEETAYFLQKVLHTDKPVVLTGAMRPATAISADGPMNLWEAVRTASDKGSAKRGVLVVMNSQIDSAETVTKTNTQMVQSFQSLGSGPAGVIVGGKIFWKQRPSSVAGTKTSAFSVLHLSQLPKVRIIYGYVGGDDGLFLKAALDDGAKGIVYAACGDGSVPEKMESLLQKAVASGVAVVIGSRCIEGIVLLPEEQTKKKGFVSSGTLNPQKAKILLQLALTKTNSVTDIQEMFVESFLDSYYRSKDWKSHQH